MGLLGLNSLMFEDDIKYLREEASKCSGYAVEIGSFRGSSTAVIAEVFDGILFSIDPYDNRLIEMGMPGTGLSIRLFNKYNKWLQKRALRGHGNVVMVHECSYDVAETFRDNTISFLFIDGDHSYPAVKLDLMMYIPKLISGGTLMLHDKFNKSVQRAIDEEVTEERFSYINRDIDNSFMSCIARKR